MHMQHFNGRVAIANADFHRGETRAMVEREFQVFRVNIPVGLDTVLARSVTCWVTAQ
jgi:hypothetical protein